MWRFESESSASTDALNARRRNRFHTDPVPHTDPIPAEFTRLHSGELRIWFLVNTFVKEQSRTRGALWARRGAPLGAAPAVSQQTRFLPAAPEPPGLPCSLLTRNPSFTCHTERPGISCLHPPTVPSFSAAPSPRQPRAARCTPRPSGLATGGTVIETRPSLYFILSIVWRNTNEI